MLITAHSSLLPEGTHNADSIIESKVIYYLEQCRLGV